MRSEKKELNQEQLEQVTGGRDAGYYLPADHGRHIDLYEAEGYIGSQVYIVNDDDREIFYWGTLVKSYEKSSNDGKGVGLYDLSSKIERTQKIQITGCNSYYLVDTSYVGQTHEFPGDDWSLFLMH